MVIIIPLSIKINAGGSSSCHRHRHCHRVSPDSPVLLRINILHRRRRRRRPRAAVPINRETGERARVGGHSVRRPVSDRLTAERGREGRIGRTRTDNRSFPQLILAEFKVSLRGRTADEDAEAAGGAAAG